jgi:hypothetical protein
MSQYILKQFVKGIALQGETADVTELVEGSLFHNSTDSRLKSFIEGQTRQLLTNSQVQDMSNKRHLGLFKVVDSGGTIDIGTTYFGNTDFIHVWSVFNDAGKTAQFGSWLANGNGGQTLFSGSRVNSTPVGDGVYTSGQVKIETTSSSFFQDAPNIAINSGSIQIITADAHVSGTYSNANSGNIFLQTGTAEGSGTRGVIELNSSGVSLKSDSFSSTSQLTFIGADESFIGVYTEGLQSTDYVSRGTPTKTGELHLVSGAVSDPTIGTDKVDSGQILLFSGPITSGTGDSGAIALTSGDSASGNSGGINLRTGLAASGTRGGLFIDVSAINVNSTRIVSVADPIDPQDASTKEYVDSEISTQDTSIRSYVDSQLTGKANATHTHDLSDINQSGATLNQVPVWNGTSWSPATVSGAGSSAFTDLTDVPSSYTGQSGKIVAVKSTEDGLEFISGGAGETNTASNVGLGAGIYKEKVGADLRLKSLTQGSGISLTENADDIEISSTITQYTDSQARTATVEDAIVDGVLDKAPSQNAVFDALALKQDSIGYTPENSANKSTDILLGTSDTLYPTQNAVKSYVDSSIGSSVVDATSSVKGIIQLAGDLAGTASSPTVPALADKVESASNLGSGQGIFSSKIGVDLQLKSLAAGPNVSLTSDANSITIHNTFVESVNSVNSKTGIVVLDKTDIGLSNVDNTSDANKPVSTATQTALNLKANTNLDNLISTVIPSGISLNSVSIITTNNDTQFQLRTSDQTLSSSGSVRIRSGNTEGTFISGGARVASGTNASANIAGTATGNANIATGNISGGSQGSTGAAAVFSGSITATTTFSGNSGVAFIQSGNLSSTTTGISGDSYAVSGSNFGTGISRASDTYGTGFVALRSGEAAGALSGRSGLTAISTGRSASAVSGAVIVSTGPVTSSTLEYPGAINNVTNTSGTGEITITSGAIQNVSSTAASGSVTLQTGSHSGAGISGNINIQTGSTSGGTRGDINLNANKVNVNATLDLNNNDIVEVGIFYFGDPNTDGTWRIRPSAGNLVTEVRQSGVWVVKQTITA